MLFLRVLCGKKGFVFMDCRHESSSVALSLHGIHECFPSLILDRSHAPALIVTHIFSNI